MLPLDIPPPPSPPSVEIRCCSVADLLAGLVESPTLIVADPPWSYSQAPGVASPGLIYSTVTDEQIAGWLAAAYWVAARNSRLAVWCTWPKLGEWFEAIHYLHQGEPARRKLWAWRYKTGGSWHKRGTPGVGYHWRGHSEFALVYAKGNPLRPREILLNAHESPRGAHSEKPVEWLAQWLEAWTEPGDLVVDLFAGLAPLARAAARTGRRYIGAEIDPERAEQARGLLAMDKQNWIQQGR